MVILTLRRWTLLTWGGWVLGIPFIALSALLGEAVGLGGAQVFVGLGMGAAVGLVQARAGRAVIGRAAPWFWSSTVGLAIPFLASDVAKVAGLDLPYSLQWALLLGGLVVGLWQARLMRPRLRGRWMWIVASLAGWGMAAASAAWADSTMHGQRMRGIVGALAYLGAIAGGGLVLGLVTGATMVWMQRRPFGDAEGAR